MKVLRSKLTLWVFAMKKWLQTTGYWQVSDHHMTEKNGKSRGNGLHYDYFILTAIHDDVIKWKQFPRYWPFVREIHRSPVNSPHKGQWRGALMFSLICARINGWVNNGEAGDLRRHTTHCDVIVIVVIFLVATQAVISYIANRPFTILL